MKKMICLLLIIFAWNQVSQGEYVNGVNWADRVISHTSKIASFVNGGCSGSGSLPMVSETPATTWLVLGPSDSDQNGNMYAWDWDQGDKDYVAGWRTGSPLHAEQEIIVEFDHGLRDIDANDVVVRMYCGPLAQASVWASTDGAVFTQIGVIEGELNQVPGTGGYFYDATFDFDGKFSEDVHFIRVFREVTVSNSGIFFDSFRSAYTDMPTDRNDVALLGWALAEDVNKDAYVNLADFAIMADQWQACNAPEDAAFDESWFDDPATIPSTCHGVWQAGMGLQADTNHDCKVDILDLADLAQHFLSCNNPTDINCNPTW